MTSRTYERLKAQLMRLHSEECPVCHCGLIIVPKLARQRCLCGKAEWVIQSGFAGWMQLPGDFSKWVFPVIRHMGAVDVIDQLVRVQPMAGPVLAMLYTLTRMPGRCDWDWLPACYQK